MARTSRQSKILELISTKELETQEDLVTALKNAGYDITQATISRDIKELGLIKILSGDTGKYKYAIVDNSENAISNKYIEILKHATISVKTVQNFSVMKTIKGMASSICNFIDKLNIENILGATYGDDTVLLIFPTIIFADKATNSLKELIG